MEGIRELPKWKGWTVDCRLRQFRRIDKLMGMEFVDFKSDEGDAILCDIIKHAKKGEFLTEVMSAAI